MAILVFIAIGSQLFASDISLSKTEIAKQRLMSLLRYNLRELFTSTGRRAQ